METRIPILPRLFSFLALYSALLYLLRPWHRRWGATDDEVAERLPGDELSAGPWVSTHAITIDAPAHEVWRWLVQIGQDRAGFYSYSFLENLFRAGIHNADRIVPEWQRLEAGDTVRLGSEKVYGDTTLLRVVALEPNSHFVLQGWGTFVVRPLGPERCRLIVRSHKNDPITGRLLDYLFWQPAHFVMERGMLRGIKKRAERHVWENHLEEAA